MDEPTQSAILSHADLLARAGRHDDARRVAKSLDNAEFGNLIEARIALDEGDPKRALEHLDKVFPSWPNNAGARYYAARAAEQLGDFARAVEEYRQSIRSAPEQTEAALRLAKLYRAGGALAECWSNAWQYVTVYTEDPEGARTIVSCATRDEKATLQGLFRQLWGTKLWPAAVAARLHALAELNGAERGLEWLAEITGPTADLTNPFFAELLREQVRLQLSAGRKTEAEKSVAAALTAHPDDSALLEIRAMLLESTGGEPAAVQTAFEAAVAKDSKNWLALEGVARAKERSGDLAGAIEAYDRSTKIHPESPEAARQAAILATKAGARPEEIAKRWLDLLKEHPWDGPAAAVYARLLLDRGETDATTLDFAERGVLFGGGKEAEKLLIAVHEARGEKDRARQVAQAFAEGKPIPPRKSAAATPSGEAARPETTEPETAKSPGSGRRRRRRTARRPHRRRPRRPPRPRPHPRSPKAERSPGPDRPENAVRAQRAERPSKAGEADPPRTVEHDRRPNRSLPQRESPSRERMSRRLPVRCGPRAGARSDAVRRASEPRGGRDKRSKIRRHGSAGGVG
ncbi:MAG: tetratricopeptide repeat protein [Deltaproteobacteria bacterium]|nr:tetratricopeptide repeat protein [Deltaproteobacteria bacterium]